ncbi:hypothetical protein CALVIDRAFT_60657 [Calocera viscosa TUFC12733]|uniref:Uncharacterized protein n=1 Tax=Calocera viscosa (strain TUFC12733) TaxID=1330018 RepID=A0A167NK28_CALVF|nr:hypothetical protein CALVIDRAFT_60657 [Calocera viscosa TUFC12733]
MDVAGPALFPSPPVETSASAAEAEMQHARLNGNGKRPFHAKQSGCTSSLRIMLIALSQRPAPTAIDAPSFCPSLDISWSFWLLGNVLRRHASASRTYHVASKGTGGWSRHLSTRTKHDHACAYTTVRDFRSIVIWVLQASRQIGYAPPATPNRLGPTLPPMHSGHRPDRRMSGAAPYPSNPSHNGNMGPPPTPVHRRASGNHSMHGTCQQARIWAHILRVVLGTGPPAFGMDTPVLRPQTAPIPQGVPPSYFTPQQHRAPLPFHPRTNLPPMNSQGPPATPQGPRFGNVPKDKARRFVPAGGKPNSQWTRLSEMGQ